MSYFSLNSCKIAYYCVICPQTPLTSGCWGLPQFSTLLL